MVGTLRERFYAKFVPEPMSGCWLWTAYCHKVSGYGHIAHPEMAVQHAHRVSWMLHRGDIPDGLFVLHKCDVRSCVNPDHLFLGNDAINSADKVQKNRHRHILERSQVERIFLLRSQQLTQRAIAETVGVSRACVSDILRGRRYKRIGMPRDVTDLSKRLTDDDVSMIRKLVGRGVRHREIAAMMGCSRGYVSELACGLKRSSA